MCVHIFKMFYYSCYWGYVWFWHAIWFWVGSSCSLAYDYLANNFVNWKTYKFSDIILLLQKNKDFSIDKKIEKMSKISKWTILNALKQTKPPLCITYPIHIHLLRIRIFHPIRTIHNFYLPNSLSTDIKNRICTFI